MTSPPEQDHILLIQTPTPSNPAVSVPSTPVSVSNPGSSAFSTANIIRDSTASSSIPQPQLTSPLDHKDRGQQSLAPPPPKTSLFPRVSPSSSVASAYQAEQDQQMQDDYLGSPAAHTSTVHSTTSRGDNGSKSSLLYHEYVRSPFQSFMHYLSSADRESPSAKASFPPLLRRLPPWLLPRYHNENDVFSLDDSRDRPQRGRRGRRPQWTRGRVVRSAILKPLCRLLILWVILAVLIAATIVYSFRPGQPELSDYGALTSFDWTPINPRSYLSPMNASFGDQYDVLLDGHSHSVYSDGRMTPETLIKWHIGESRIFLKGRKKKAMIGR